MLSSEEAWNIGLNLEDCKYVWLFPPIVWVSIACIPCLCELHVSVLCYCYILLGHVPICCTRLWVRVGYWFAKHWTEGCFAVCIAA